MTFIAAFQSTDDTTDVIVTCHFTDIVAVQDATATAVTGDTADTIICTVDITFVNTISDNDISPWISYDTADVTETCDFTVVDAVINNSIFLESAADTASVCCS